MHPFRTAFLLWGLPALALPALSATLANRLDRLEWFRDQGFGLFIHWSVDSQLGAVISHSMVGASEDYVNRFVNELPKTFNSRKFNPQDRAALAKLAGIRYVVFTARRGYETALRGGKAESRFGCLRTPTMCAASNDFEPRILSGSAALRKRLQDA